jgi:hypothetical protein
MRNAAGSCSPFEIIADNLSKAGWSWGCLLAIDSNGRTIWIADAHRGDGKRFVVDADERLSALLEVETVIRPYSRHAKYEFNLSHARTGPHPTPQRDDGPHAFYCGEWPRVDEQRVE